MEPPAKLIIAFFGIRKIAIVGTPVLVHDNKLHVTVGPLNNLSACVLCNAVIPN